jgi:pimeloyl-ACP methyl ester carboxylesterase
MPILRLDDVDLHYDVHGEGPAMLFCSATATHGDVWKFYQVPEFSRDHQVITFDLRGTGQSALKSSAKSVDLSAPRLAADAAALLDYLKVSSAIVLGHSNGGRVAQQLTVDRPDLVKKLILMSSGGETRKRGISVTICKELVEMGYEAYVLHHTKEVGFSKSFLENNPLEIRRFLKVRLANPPPLELYLHHVAGRLDFDIGARINDIRIPVLVVVGGDEDHGAAGHMTHFAAAKALAEKLPNAKLEVLEGQGHYYYFTVPEKFNRLVRDFIESKDVS